ncbi:MAG: hypothetical protein SGJ15_13460 [Bacteroidota bacterium]|nr:hypothetical protein [Bacteroidota bacterium]
MASTFNPYPLIGTQLTSGLDAIVTAAPTTVDDLVDEIFTYVSGIYYSGGGGLVPIATEIEIKSVAYNIINAYNNNPQTASLGFTRQQSIIIDMLLGCKTICKTPVNALNVWFEDIQDNITKADLNIDSQTPLLLAAVSGTSVYSYWITKVGTPGGWSAYFETDAYKNYINVPIWTTACIEGALIGSHASPKGLISPTTNITSVTIISALIGALAIGAGKVIFGWVPRIQPGELSGTEDSCCTN